MSPREEIVQHLTFNVFPAGQAPKEEEVLTALAAVYAVRAGDAETEINAQATAQEVVVAFHLEAFCNDV